MRSRDRRRRRPKAEKEDNNSENHCPSIDDNTEDTRKTEWSPDKLISLACVVGDVCRLSDSTGASTPEEKALRDDVRSVETTYAKGDGANYIFIPQTMGFLQIHTPSYIFIPQWGMNL